MTMQRMPKRGTLLALGLLAIIVLVMVVLYSLNNASLGRWRGSELAPWTGSSTAVEYVTLDFSSGAKVEGSDSCGPFTADYSINDKTMHVSNERVAANACADEKGRLS